MIKDFKVFPYKGEFYRDSVDTNKPLEEQSDNRQLILKTKCDIQQANKNDSGNFIDASFNIYIPIDTNKPLKIRRGDVFEGEMYGMKVNGEVIGLYGSQLGGCTIYIRDLDI